MRDVIALVSCSCIAVGLMAWLEARRTRTLAAHHRRRWIRLARAASAN